MRGLKFENLFFHSLEYILGILTQTQRKNHLSPFYF